MSAGPRSRAKCLFDVEHQLSHDVDVWVASASPDGAPYLVPLSFDWDGEALLRDHADEQPDRPEPGRRPGPFAWGWATPATCP